MDMFTNRPWRKQRMLAADDPSDDLHLGQDVNDITIRCKLKSKQSVWCQQGPQPSNVLLRGLLYFTLDFQERGHPRLMSADVDIAVFEDDKEKNPVTVTLVVPQKTFLPADVLMREKWDTKTTEIAPEVEVAGVGARAGSRVHEQGTKYEIEQNWSFRSGQPSEPHRHKAEFSWKRTSADDETGLHRKYEGAFVFRQRRQDTGAKKRESNVAVLRDIVLSVGVSIRAKGFRLPHLGGTRKLGKIGTSSGEVMRSDKFGKEIDENKLEDIILTRNSRQAPIRLQSSSDASSESRRLRDEADKQQHNSASTQQDSTEQSVGPLDVPGGSSKPYSETTDVQIESHGDVLRPGSLNTGEDAKQQMVTLKPPAHNKVLPLYHRATQDVV